MSFAQELHSLLEDRAFKADPHLPPATKEALKRDLNVILRCLISGFFARERPPHIDHFTTILTSRRDGDDRIWMRRDVLVKGLASYNDEMQACLVSKARELGIDPLPASISELWKQVSERSRDRHQDPARFVEESEAQAGLAFLQALKSSLASKTLTPAQFVDTVSDRSSLPFNIFPALGLCLRDLSLLGEDAGGRELRMAIDSFRPRTDQLRERPASLGGRRRTLPSSPPEAPGQPGAQKRGRS